MTFFKNALQLQRKTQVSVKGYQIEHAIYRIGALEIQSNITSLK